MKNQGFIKNFSFPALPVPNRIVCFGAADGTVAYPTLATDYPIGITPEGPAPAVTPVTNYGTSTIRGDVVLSHIEQVMLGATVTRGQRACPMLDGTGRAQAAAPAAGVNTHCIGTFIESGVAGDLVGVLIVASTLQG